MTELNPLSPEEEVPVENANNGRAFWGTLVLAGMLLLTNVYFLTFVFRQAGTPKSIGYTATALFIAAILTTIVSIVLTILHRQETGLRITFYTLLSIGLIVPILFQGRTLSASLSILFLSVMIIWGLFPSRSRVQNLAVTAVIILLMWTIEWLNPSWRIQDQAGNIGPFAVFMFGVFLAILWATQSRGFVNHSLRLKIILWSGVGFFISAAFIIGYAVIQLRNEAIRSAEVGAQDIAHGQAAEIQTVLERTLSAGEIFTDSVIVGKTEGVPLSREQVNAMLRQVLKDNPRFVGVDVLFEPNAFDGKDAEFVNTEGSDANGRFLPYWTRGEGGKIQVELLQDYDVSDWYQCPKLTKVPCLIDPYVYPVQGQDVWMTSLVIPFVYNDTFLGITGIDTPVTFLQDLADRADIYDGAGEIAIISNNGTLLGVTGQPELLGQPVTAIHEHFAQEDYQKIAAGEEILSYSPKQDLEVYVPIQVGETASPWSVNVIIPRSAILADATKQMWQMIGIGGGLLVISLIVLFYAASQVTQPIEKITDVAKQVTTGNLEVVADVQAVDETGILADAFNTMVTQLRELLGTLEQRVEERTRSLELAARVGRTVSQVSDLDSMLKQATQLILEQFDLYYVQVYLTDMNQKMLKMVAGTGDVGAQLFERGHSLPVSTASINGRAAVEKRAMVIPDTTESPTFRSNPLLPDTRGEMTLPLIVGEKVVGVLDLQTRYPGRLTDELLPAYEALAGQLAVAIQNAKLLDEAEQARAEVEAQARRQIRVAWDEHLDAIHKPEQIGFVYDRNEITPLVDESEMPDEGKAVSAPIALTGEELGSLVVEVDNERKNEQTDELVSIVARQVAQQIENLRLLENAERYRFEAEQAARRQTREGWQEYLKSRADSRLGYLFDLKEVRPYSNGHGTDQSLFTLPLKVRDEAIGKLSVDGLAPDDVESVELVNDVAERLSAHIDSLRQYDRTQSALAQSEKLFDASRYLTQATDLQELVTVTVETLGISEINRAVLGVFNYDSDDKFESMSIVANWWDGTGHEVTPIGTRYPVEIFRTVSLFASSTPTFFEDAFTDPRADSTTLALAKRQNLRAVAVLPLFLGSRQIGVLMLESEKTHKFTDEETRLFSALAPQIATTLENRRQFEQAQKQAERETMLNTINQKIQSATSVEAVLQIAARELGHALGAPMTIAQLSMKDQN